MHTRVALTAVADLPHIDPAVLVFRVLPVVGPYVVQRVLLLLHLYGAFGVCALVDLVFRVRPLLDHRKFLM